MKPSAILASICLSLLLVPAAYGEENCRLERAATLPMTGDGGGRVSVPMTVSGHEINLIVDTGSAMSMMSELAVSTLGLRQIATQHLAIELYGGEASRRYVVARDMSLGGTALRPMPFFVAPDERFRAGISGLIGADFMRRYDVELDFANARLNLFSSDHCPGEVVYWTKDLYARIPFQFDRDEHIRIPVKLDGREMTAQLDTGAEQTLGSLEDVAEDFGIDDPDTALGLGSRARVYHYPFKLLTFGGVEVINPAILLLPNDVSKMPRGERELIIGMNVLHRLHLYIAYKERALYVTSADAH